MAADENICPLCGSKKATKTKHPDFYGYFVKCPVCGRFALEETAQDLLESTYKDREHIVAGYLFEINNKKSRSTFEIREKQLIGIFQNEIVPKTFMQKLDKLLIYYYRKNDTFGKRLSFNQNTPPAIGYAKNCDEISNMIYALIEMGWFKKHSSNGQLLINFSITPEGLKRAESLITTNIDSKKVFVAMGFYTDLRDAHENAICPACKACGFDAFLINETEHNDDINYRIISEIKSSKFVIADLTYNNLGAYFEAGYAQGRGLAVIRTCKKEWFDGKDEKGESNHLHFDVSHYNFILWDSVEDLKEKLIDCIHATIL